MKRRGEASSSSHHGVPSAPEAKRPKPKAKLNPFSAFVSNQPVNVAASHLPSPLSQPHGKERRRSLLPSLRMPSDDYEEREDPPQLPSVSHDSRPHTPYRATSPSVASMGRAASASMDGGPLPPPPDIQHIEGEVWFIATKGALNTKKRDSSQWAVCEDHRLSIYSSWAESSRLVETMVFDRVRILFDYLHPHKHPSKIGGGGPATRRITIPLDQPLTAAQSRAAFHVRDPLASKTLAGYYYFGVEGVMRDADTGKLRRSLVVLSTDRPEDHRQWMEFWEEMQQRYPMVRTRNTGKGSVDLSSEWMSDFIFPQEQTSTSKAASHLQSSPPNTDHQSPFQSPILDDFLDRTQMPTLNSTQRLTDSSILAATAAQQVSIAMIEKEMTALVAEVEAQARDGITAVESATRAVLEADYSLHLLCDAVLPEVALTPLLTDAAPIPARFLGRKKTKREGDTEGDSSDESAKSLKSGNSDPLDLQTLQEEVRTLCALLLEQRNNSSSTSWNASAASGKTTTTAVLPQNNAEANLASSEESVCSSTPLPGDALKELETLRTENAALREQYIVHEETVRHRIEDALSTWMRAAAPTDAKKDFSLYAVANEALVCSLVQAATTSIGSDVGAAQQDMEPPSLHQTQRSSLTTDDELTASTRSDVGVLLSLPGEATTALPLPSPYDIPHSKNYGDQALYYRKGSISCQLPPPLKHSLQNFTMEHQRRIAVVEELPVERNESSIEVDESTLLTLALRAIVDAFQRLITPPPSSLSSPVSPSKILEDAAEEASHSSIANSSDAIDQAHITTPTVAVAASTSPDRSGRGSGGRRQSSLRPLSPRGHEAVGEYIAAIQSCLSHNSVSTVGTNDMAPPQNKSGEDEVDVEDQDAALKEAVTHSANEVVSWLRDLLTMATSTTAYLRHLEELSSEAPLFMSIEMKDSRSNLVSHSDVAEKQNGDASAVTASRGSTFFLSSLEERYHLEDRLHYCIAMYTSAMRDLREIHDSFYALLFGPVQVTPVLALFSSSEEEEEARHLTASHNNVAPVYSLPELRSRASALLGASSLTEVISFQQEMLSGLHRHSPAPPRSRSPFSA